MKKFNLLLAVGLFSLALMSCGNSTNQNPDPDKTKVKADTSKVQAAYVCPMGKECGSGDKPGKCPGCGKDMVAAK